MSILNIEILNKLYLNVLDANGNNWSSKIAFNEWIIGGNTDDAILGKVPAIVYQNEIVRPSSNKIDEKKVGLMYISDYTFASSSENWIKLINYVSDNGYGSSENRNNNWIFIGTNLWTITSMTDDNGAAIVIGWGGEVSENWIGSTFAVRPTFYLNSNVMYVSGTGTPTDPYRID